MKTVMYDRYGDANVLSVRDIPPPAQPGKNKIHVRVVAAGLNPKDVLVRKGKFRLFTRSPFPRGVGYDFSGTVIEGARFEPGTRIFGMVNGWNGCTLAEELVCSVDECERMPEIDFEKAAAIPLAAQTALQALRDIAQTQPNETVCINGASGGVGVFAIQIAKALGAQVTTLSSARNLDLCQRLGADKALDYERDDPLSRPGGYDTIFDVFGNRSFGRVKASLKDGGTFITTVPSGRAFMEVFKTTLGHSKRARVVIVRSRAEDLANLRDWINAGKLDPIVDRVFEFDQVVEAQQYLETKRARGKVVVRVGKE